MAKHGDIDLEKNEVFDSTFGDNGGWVPQDVFEKGKTSASLAPERPAMLPKLSGRFFTKEAQAAKLAPTGYQRKVIELSYAADLARWRSLGSPGTFNEWVEKSYAPRSGRKASGIKFVAKSALGEANDFASGNDKRRGTPAERAKFADLPAYIAAGIGSKLGAKVNQNDLATGKSLVSGYDLGIIPNPVALGGAHHLAFTNQLAYRATGGQDEYENNLAEYMRLRSPAPKTSTIEDMKAVGKSLALHPWDTAREIILNPNEMATNLALALPGIGETVLGEKLAALMANSSRLARLAESGKLGAAAANVGAKGLKFAASSAPSALAGGAIGGIQGEGENPIADVATGTLMGMMQAGAGKMAAKGMGKVGGYLGLRIAKGTPAVEPHHVDASIRKRIIEKAATPDEIGEPTAQDIFTNPDVVDFARKSKETLTPRDIEVLKRLGAIVYPGFEAFSESDQIDKIMGTIVAGANAAKEAEKSAPTPLDQTSIEKLAQVLPTERGVLEHTELLPANSRVKYLNQAYSAYQTLRKNDPNFRVIPELEKPSFADVSGNFLESQQKKAAALAEEAKAARKAATDANAEEKASREQAATLAEARSIEAQTSLDNLTAALGLERDANNLHHTLKTSAALGTIKDDLLELDPKQLRLLLSQPERYAEIRPDLEKAVTPGMLKMLEDANAGGVDDATFAKISKKVLGARQEDLQATTAGQQATMDNAQAAQGIREGMAKAEESASVAEQAAAERQAKAEADAQEREDHFFATSDEGAMNLLMEEIKQNPEKAMLLLEDGRGAKLAKSLGSDKAHFASDAKKEIAPLLIDQVRKIRSGERSLPKGFF